jgi:hypothetical protein
MVQDIKSPTGTISTHKDLLTNDSMSLAPSVCKCLTHNQEYPQTGYCIYCGPPMTLTTTNAYYQPIPPFPPIVPYTVTFSTDIVPPTSVTMHPARYDSDYFISDLKQCYT